MWWCVIDKTGKSSVLTIHTGSKSFAIRRPVFEFQLCVVSLLGAGMPPDTYVLGYIRGWEQGWRFKGSYDGVHDALICHWAVWTSLIFWKWYILLDTRTPIGWLTLHVVLRTSTPWWKALGENYCHCQKFDKLLPLPSILTIFLHR